MLHRDGFQLPVSNGMLLDPFRCAVVGHDRSIAERTGFQIFLYPQIQQIAYCQIVSPGYEFLGFVVLHRLAEHGFRFGLAFCSGELRLLAITKTNYHIHLIFSERTLLPEPDIKIASRSVFYDETGKRVRTKKEITGEDGKIRLGCTVIKKGEVYEQHMFTPKDERFKDKGFLHSLKEIYTDLINRHISDPAQQLRVFDPNGVYLATKKIGKNNPKAAEIEADNAARQEWNRTADMALLSGIAEETIIELKNEEIHNKAADSVTKHGWLPELFRKIVRTAKELLQGMIRSTQLPPKPVLNMDIAEFRKMQKLMIKVQDKARHIRQMQEIDLPRLKAQLADVKGIFKGKERKALEQEIQKLEKTIREELDKLPTILEEDGYPDVQAFTATYRKAEKIVSQYNRDLAQWEQTVQKKKQPAEKPPEKQSVREQLRKLQEEGRKKPRNRSRDYER